MKKPKHWYCELYRFNVYYCVRWYPAEISEYMFKMYGLEKDYAKLGGTCLLLNDPIVVIWTHPTDKDRSFLVHECVHAANIILSQRGVQPSYGNDEAQAYLAEIIFRKAIEK